MDGRLDEIEHGPELAAKMVRFWALGFSEGAEKEKCLSDYLLAGGIFVGFILTTFVFESNSDVSAFFVVRFDAFCDEDTLGNIKEVVRFFGKKGLNEGKCAGIGRVGKELDEFVWMGLLDGLYSAGSEDVFEFLDVFVSLLKFSNKKGTGGSPSLKTVGEGIGGNLLPFLSLK